MKNLWNKFLIATTQVLQKLLGNRFKGIYLNKLTKQKNLGAICRKEIEAQNQ